MMKTGFKKTAACVLMICIAAVSLAGCADAALDKYELPQLVNTHVEVPENTASQTMEERYSGRLTIPDVGVDVALYACSSLPNDSQQEIVDAEDSAAYQQSWDFQKIPEGRFIADHNYQGFTAIRDVVANETKAYINNDDGVEEYLCVAIGEGSNLGDELVDWNGVSLNYDYIAGDLAMYTCNETWESITITYWQLVDPDHSSPNV